MKPKLSIPSRTRTPEQQALHDEWLVVNDLYVRWVNNTTTPEDGMLLLKYQQRLEDIKKSVDWNANFHMEHLNWKVAQMNLNNPKEEGSN